MSAPTTRRQSLPTAHLRTFAGAEEGVGAVEFAILLPVIILMLTALLSFGLTVYYKMQLTNATTAGAQLALLDPSDTTAISTAVLSATDLNISSSDVTITQFCECEDTSTVTCGTTCGDGSYNRYFMSVGVSTTLNLPFWSAGLASWGQSITLSDTATVRTK